VLPVGGAAIKSTEDESGAGMGSITFGWETSHTFWIGAHVLDIGTGANRRTRREGHQ